MPVGLVGQFRYRCPCYAIIIIIKKKGWLLLRRCLYIIILRWLMWVNNPPLMVAPMRASIVWTRVSASHSTLFRTWLLQTWLWPKSIILIIFVNISLSIYRQAIHPKYRQCFSYQYFSILVRLSFFYNYDMYNNVVFLCTKPISKKWITVSFPFKRWYNWIALQLLQLP